MKCISPKLIYPHRSIEWCDSHEEVPVCVPCGKCIPCLVVKRQEWSFRLEQEFKYCRGAFFVTLTYDEKHLRTDGNVNKRDVQLYLKKLRKKDGTNKLRYYCVGEYGTLSGRPHYHLLIFGGSQEHIRSSWTDSKGDSVGIVHIGRVTAASIAYCTKYLIQNDYEKNKERPFAIMSRRYGLGGRYLSDEMVCWHRDNGANYCVNGGFKVRLPRFYKSKIWYKEDEREKISVASKVLMLEKQEKELDYFKEKYPENWDSVMCQARDLVISRVKQKVGYSQTL